jgi:predicted  nucleic acid-binding Zn-ribbon protein
MESEGSKTFSLTLSPTMIITVLLATISALGSGGYYGVTLYNRAMTAIESVESMKPYDDAELSARVAALEIELKAAKERQLATADALIRISENLTNAVALARESQSTARSAVINSESVNREVQTRLESIKKEVDSVVAQLRNEMSSLKRATTNPLGR